MKTQTEMAVRSILSMDEEIKAELVEKALDVLRGKVGPNDEIDHVLRRKEVEELLHVHRRTIDYYLDKGYLTRVYGGGQRALGISRDSVLRFVRRRVGRPQG